MSVKNMIGMLVLIPVLTGCGTTNLQSGNLTGSVLGWRNELYKIVSPISGSNIGNKLGTVSYHGIVSGEFTIFKNSGTDPAKGVIFESSDGHYFKAMATAAAQ